MYTANTGGPLMSAHITAQLLQELREGEFRTAEHLPPELELAERYGVSRSVIRDALSDLEREGFIERIRGIGTVVNHEILGLKSRLDLKIEYNDLIRAAGYRPSADSVSLRVEQCDGELSERIQLDEGSPILVCEKRVLATGTPVIYSIDYLPLPLLGELDYNAVDWSVPVFDILEQYCGLNVTTTIARVFAVVGPPAIRSRLELPDSDALMLLDETGFTRLGVPIMRSLEFYTPFFEFTMLRKKF